MYTDDFLEELGLGLIIDKPKENVLVRASRRDGNSGVRFVVGIITQVNWVKYREDGYHVSRVCITDGYKDFYFFPQKQINLEEAKRYLIGRNVLDINDFNTSEERFWAA
jgi:hypothetical protein